MKRALPLIAGLLLLVISIPFFLYLLCIRPVPTLDGTEYCAGLEKSVSVKFDTHAIPYIEAFSELDVYQAQGFVTARERMFQMDMLRRSARGELAEVYGIESLESDRLMRTLGLGKLAQAEWNHLSLPAKEVLEAYAKGVNAYLRSSADKLPLEFSLLGYKPNTWRAQDTLAVMKYNAYRMDESWRLDDFRQRVQNRVGEKLATELFRDDLVAYGLPQVDKSKVAPQTPRNDQVPPTNQTQHKDQSGAISLPNTVSEREKKCPVDAPKLTAEAARSNASNQRSSQAALSNKNAPTIASKFEKASKQVLESLADFGNKAHKHDQSQPLWGSTAWVVPSAATRTGSTLLACDKDSGFTVPTDWYLCSLNAPNLHVAGASMPGVPGIVIGRTEGVAWGSANLKADVQDIFLEGFKSQFDKEYRVPGGWDVADMHTELIPVRFGNDVEHRVFTTRHGPILLRANQAAISLAWSGFDTEHPTFDGLLKLNHANNLDELSKALALYSDPAQLFVFGDRSGNVGYQMVGNIPLRVGGAQGTMLNLGWENKGAWQGYLQSAKLPRGFIPRASGAGASKLPIVAANQRPAPGGTVLPKLDGSIFLGHQWQPPYRANRLLDAINNATTTGQMSPTEMNLLQGDQYSQLAPLVTKALQDAALATNYVDSKGVASITSLVKWDGQMKASGTQATILEAYLQTLIRRCIEPSLGRSLSMEYMQRWPLWRSQSEHILRDRPALLLPPEERTYDTFFLTTLVQSMKSLHIAFGNTYPDKWNWGVAHQALFQDLASSGGAWFSRFTRLGPVPVGGSSECVNSCEVRADANGLTYWCMSGPTERMIVDMGDSDKFYQALSTGQSGHLFSPFRADQLPSWVRVDLIPIAFSPDQIIKQVRHRLVLLNEFGTK